MSASVCSQIITLNSKESKNMSSVPLAIVVISGKRKSGKDFLAKQLQHRIGKGRCSIHQLSGPLKEAYAKEHNLNCARLMDSSEYKEQYRADMIKWGEDKRSSDPGYFCRIVCQEAIALGKPIWIVSDARRQSDIEYFQAVYPDNLLTVRVKAEEAVRRRRGWEFVQGIDDAPSECGLDQKHDFDLIVFNNGSQNELSRQLDCLLDKVAQIAEDAT